jgi:carbonic anhydrase/acetyltransferase-like protein (isoleucine patch superfamily)
MTGTPKVDSTAYVAPSAVIEGDVTVGREASIWHQAVLRGDTERIVVGDRTNVQDGAILHADPGVPCLVGSGVTVGHQAVLHGCVVDDDVLVGIGAIVLNGARVGRGSVIAAGALVPERANIPPGSLLMGVPCRVVGPVDDALASRSAASRDHYVRLAEEHRLSAEWMGTPGLAPTGSLAGRTDFDGEE